MEKNMSACGMYECAGCQHQSSGNCPGCIGGNRQLRDAGEQICAVFECVEKRGITSCEVCDEAACVLKRTVESICPLRSRYENRRWWAGRMSRALESKKRIGREPINEEKISARVVSRLRYYLTALDGLEASGAISVSSWQIAERVGVNAALIRKDLSRFGEFGTPSFGYKIDYLTERIRGILRLDEPKGVVWIGAACFQLYYPCVVARLGRHTCDVVGVLDVDEEEIGKCVGDQEVQHLDVLANVMSKSVVHTAVLAIPGPEARIIAEKLTRSGIKAILNVSGEMLVLPDNVKVTNFDLVGELMELCYYSGK